MKKYCCSFVSFLFVMGTIFSQQALELSNLPNNTPVSYPYNFVFPLESELLLRNGYQLMGNQFDLDNHTPFQIYYDSDTLSTTSNSLDIINNTVLMAGKLIQLQSGFHIGSGTGIFSAIIEKKLADYDTNTSGLQAVTEYDPDFRFRYFMSIFGPRLILRNGVYRYDFHQGSDIIDIERPEDNVPIVDLPNIQCMCDGVITEFVKLDDPADISNPNGVGRKTGIHCSRDTIVEPPLGDNSKILEATGEGQYLVVKCQEQYPVSLGYSDNDIYIAYRHLYNFAQDFEIGDTISKGALIGKMGQSGITSNYHLHLSALRRACSEAPAKRFINVHPMYLFNPDYNSHLLRKLEVNPSFDNNSSSIKHQEINPEISFLNYDTITSGANPIIRIALPYSQTNLQKIVIRDRNGVHPTNEWVFNLLERGIENEEERDKNHWDMNGDGKADTVYIHHFNRGTSAQFLYNSHQDEAHYEGHPGRDWPITSTGLYRTAAYILDLKIVDFTGDKNDLEVEVIDIWGNGIKGELPIDMDISTFKYGHSESANAKISDTSFLDFSIFPNPSINQQFQIALSAKESFPEVSIEFFNSLGQSVHQQTIAIEKNSSLKQTMNLRHLAKGVYIVRVLANQVMLSRKIILE